MTELDNLISVFCKISDPDEMKAFFFEIFTKNEISDFSSRWGLMIDLINGTPQRTIAQNRKISLCKITRGSKLIKDSGSVSNKILKHYIESEKI